MIDIENIKKLRDETGAGIVEVKKALEQFEGDFEKARALLMSKVADKAAKKSDRTTKDGLVEAYIHGAGKVGSLLWIACETDFVAKTDDFKKLAHEIAMQICSENYDNVDALLASEYMRDTSKKIGDMINEVIAKVGEKIEIKGFSKFDVRA